jgi:hypothetical protein
VTQEELKSRIARLEGALWKLLMALKSTTVYTGVRDGKSTLARAWNEAEEVLNVSRTRNPKP